MLFWRLLVTKSYLKPPESTYRKVLIEVSFIWKVPGVTQVHMIMFTVQFTHSPHYSSLIIRYVVVDPHPPAWIQTLDTSCQRKQQLSVS